MDFLCRIPPQFHIRFCSYHVIANPLERKMTMPKAIFMVFLVWCYTLPWALFPYFQIWGRFVPGKSHSILEFIIHQTYSNRIPSIGGQISRGIFNIMHIWLFDRHVRHTFLRCRSFFIQLLLTNEPHHLLLQSNSEACIQSWEKITRASEKNERWIVACKSRIEFTVGRSSYCKGCNYNLLPLCRMWVNPQFNIRPCIGSTNNVYEFSVDTIRGDGTHWCIRRQSIAHAKRHNDSGVHVQIRCLPGSIRLRN